MRGPWRAATALALHIGLFSMSVALVIGLAGIAVYTYRYDTATGLRSAAAMLVVTTVLAVLLRTVLRNRTRPHGVALPPRSQRDLWKMVDDVAVSADCPAPDQIRITSEPCARLREDTRLLGLSCTKRYLEIGLPLIAGLTVSELRAVVARELGVLSGAGKLDKLAYRSATCVERTLTNLTGGATKWIFSGYARLYAVVSNPLVRRVELDADEVAARVAGKRVTLATMRKTAGIQLGWRDYSREYLSMAVAVEQTPDVVLGFRAFLEHPERKKQLAQRAKQAIAEESLDISDLHHTRLERIEATKKSSARDLEPDSQPALSLITEPKRTVPELEDQLMVDGMGSRVPWPEMTRLAGAQQATNKAAMLSAAVLQSGVSSDPTLAGVLGAIHQGQGPDIVNPALDPGLPADEVDHAVVDRLTELLGASVVDALVRAGSAQHELDWGGPPKVRLTSGQILDPDRLVRPAVADPRLIPGLHRHLVQLGVPLDHAQPAADDPEPVLLGIVSPVDYAGNQHELLVTDRGLLLVAARTPKVQRLLADALAWYRRSEQEALTELASTPIGELRQDEDAQWVDSRDIAAGRLLQQRQGWDLSLELYMDDFAVSELSLPPVTRNGGDAGEDELAVMRLHGPGDCCERGDPYSGLGQLLGARLQSDDDASRANE